MDNIQQNDAKVEIVVTPEMEEAGLRVLRASGIVDELAEQDSLLVAEIYRAMFDEARDSSENQLKAQEMQKTCCKDAKRNHIPP